MTESGPDVRAVLAQDGRVVTHPKGGEGAGTGRSGSDHKAGAVHEAGAAQEAAGVQGAGLLLTRMWATACTVKKYFLNYQPFFCGNSQQKVKMLLILSRVR